MSRSREVLWLDSAPLALPSPLRGRIGNFSGRRRGAGGGRQGGRGMPWCTGRSTREGADTAPLGADSLWGWCVRNPAVVKGGGSGQIAALADGCYRGWGSACERPAAGYGVAAVWSGWGRGRDVGARRQVEVGEEGAHEVPDPGWWRRCAAGRHSEARRGKRDRAYDASTPPRSRRGWGRRGGLAREGGSVWGGAAVADNLGAPARARGEDAVVEKQVHRGTGDEGRQLLEEFDGLEEEVGGAVAPHRLGVRRGRARRGGGGGDPERAGGGGDSGRVARGGRDRWGGTQTLACRSKPSRWPARSPRGSRRRASR